MVWFSYTVDRSGLFQGELAPRRIVDLMLQGYDVTNFDSMDEREVVQLYAQDVPETPQVIGGGSSRVLQFSREVIGTDSFFQHGRDRRRCARQHDELLQDGHLRKGAGRACVSVDPWVFYDDPMAYDERADADLYNEFLTKVLGVPTDYEEPDQVELWKALAEPAYFQGNVDYFVKKPRSGRRHPTTRATPLTSTPCRATRMRSRPTSSARTAAFCTKRPSATRRRTRSWRWRRRPAPPSTACTWKALTPWARQPWPRSRRLSTMRTNRAQR